MEALLQPLLPLFERERAAGRALVLGVLVRTDGSTYRKPGAALPRATSTARSPVILIKISITVATASHEPRPMNQKYNRSGVVLAEVLAFSNLLKLCYLVVWHLIHIAIF